MYALEKLEKKHMIALLQNIVGPTPPGSNKPPTAYGNDQEMMTDVTNTASGGGVANPAAGTTTLNSVNGKPGRQTKAAVDPTGNLPHDQLSKMFPTPPSHEAPLSSPAEDGAHGEYIW